MEIIKSMIQNICFVSIFDNIRVIQTVDHRKSSCKFPERNKVSHLIKHEWQNRKKNVWTYAIHLVFFAPFQTNEFKNKYRHKPAILKCAGLGLRHPVVRRTSAKWHRGKAADDGAPACRGRHLEPPPRYTSRRPSVVSESAVFVWFHSGIYNKKCFNF